MLQTYFIIVLVFVSINSAACTNLEGQLLKKILHNYDPLFRPVTNSGGTVTLKMNLYLLQLLEVNEKSQTLALNIWLSQQWTDVHLRWNATEFEGINVLHIPYTKIWSPDLHMFNRADMDSSTSSAEYASQSTNAVVFSNGTVVYVPPLIVKSSCVMDFTWFPFDTQTCELIYGCWTHNANEVDLQMFDHMAPINLRDFVAHGEWHVLDVNYVRKQKFYECCKEPFVSLTFTLRLKRRVLYFLFNLIVPCGLIGFLALLGFTLPPDSSEKLTLGVTVLFSLIVFLNMIAESMPANSDAVPLLGTYFSCVMVMIASSVVSTIVVNWNRRSLRPPIQIQGLVRKICLRWLPKILLMSPLDHTGRLADNPKDPTNDEISDAKSTSDTDMQIATADRAKLEWKYVALVADRFFFILSVMFVLTAFGVLICSASSSSVNKLQH